MIMANSIGLLIIGLIVWWFWFYKVNEIALQSDRQHIEVANGTYRPSRITAPANTAITLVFLRDDESPCSETVLFPELEISAQLAQGELTSVEIPPLMPGSYSFQCQMKMYQGTLLVKEKTDES
jgi:plastocyanin domain-containing protein